MPKRDHLKRSEATKATVKRRQFLEYIARGMTLTEATQAAGISRQYVYVLLRKSERFANAYRDAQERSADLLEAAARRRAIDGVDRYVTYAGQIVFVKFDRDGQPIPPGSKRRGTLRPLIQKEYSDALLVRMLIARLPRLYGRADPAEEKPAAPTREDAVAALDHILAELGKSPTIDPPSPSAF